MDDDDDDGCALISLNNKERRRCVNLSYFIQFSSVEFSVIP